MLNKYNTNSNIDIDCLLPNGLLISLNIAGDLTLSQILEKLNQQASDLFETKVNFDNYIFTSLNEEAQTVEFYDLSKKLCDLHIFQEYPFFKLINNETLDYNAKLLKSELS